MKVSTIINVMETYNRHKRVLQNDILAYQDYKIFDNDDKKAKEIQAKIQRDKQILGQFLDTEI